MKILFLIIALLPCLSHANTCVTTDNNGFVVVTGETIELCTTMVLMSKDEFTASTSVTDILTMSQADYEEFAKAFLILLTLAVSIKLVMRQLVPK